VQVTPNYLQQIAVTHCPITRETLTEEQASIDRVRNDAGYAAGNLVMMSQRANQAKGASDFAAACEQQVDLSGRPTVLDLVLVQAVGG